MAQTAAAVDVLRKAVLAGAVVALDEDGCVERGILLAYGAQPLRGGVAAEIVFERIAVERAVRTGGEFAVADRLPSAEERGRARRRREAARGRWTSRFLSGG